MEPDKHNHEHTHEQEESHSHEHGHAHGHTPSKENTFIEEDPPTVERSKSPFWDQQPGLLDNSLLNNTSSASNSKNTFKIPGTPPGGNFMDCIYESDKEDNDNDAFFQPPSTSSSKAQKRSSLGYLNSPQQPPSMQSFYMQGNNSSGNLIANPGFTFGENLTVPPTSSSNTDSANTNLDFFLPPPPMLEANGTGGSDHSGYGGAGAGSRRNSRYMPSPKFPSASRINKSPTRKQYSPERKSVLPGSPNLGPRKDSDSPFNFQPLNMNNSLNSNGSTVPSPANSNSNIASRTAFRKGHRYKHSSVSMNFFQEPEVTIPLNIAKALPIPDLYDLKKNLIWPQSHLKICLTLSELVAWLVCLQLGQRYHWNNFVTLSHFLFFDVLGASVLILVEILKQFEVWNQGTITFPFGLNRLEIILSFTQAISLCYMGMDLLFHVLEEGIVQFIEATSTEHEISHDDVDSKIPHSHETTVLRKYFHIWYLALLLSFIVSLVNYYYTFQNKKMKNKFNKFTISSPIVTLTYVGYLLVYPLFPSPLLDYAATLFISLFIFQYGAQIVRYSSNILLLGFSSQEFDIDTFKLMDQITNDIKTLPEYNLKNCDFKSCQIFKVNFNTFVALIRIQMIGGSNERERLLRQSIDRYLRNKLLIKQDKTGDDSEDEKEAPQYTLESTIEIDLV